MGAVERWVCFVIGVVRIPFILLKHEPFSSVVFGMVIGGVGGLLAGFPIGRMLACSHFMRSLAREPVSIRATPGHVDGAAGLKPLGDYIIYQSLLLAIPSIFLLTWSLLFRIDGSSNDYKDLAPWYLGGLVLTIGVEIAAFTLPLSGVREMMKQQKTRALDVADTLVQDIADARKELERDLETDRRATVRDRLDLLTRKYIEIETMRTWPFDRGGRQQLTLGNLSLIAPAVAQVLIFLAGKS